MSVELFAGQGQQVLGQIQISRFLNNAGLQPIGSNLYKETIASGVPNVLNPGLEGLELSGKVLWRLQTSMLSRKW